MSMIGKIRRMYFRDHKKIREIARLTSLSRNTIRTWLRQDELREPKYQRSSVACKLDDYQSSLEQALLADAHRPKRDRRTGKALFATLYAKGYRGSYSRVTDFIRAWHKKQGASPTGKAFVPLKFAFGEAFQFDWSEEGLIVGGLYYKVQVAHMKLCASRAFWLVAYPSQGHEMLFDAHERCFAGLGGIARRGIYGNMKTAIDRIIDKGKGRIVNSRFAMMCAHYLYDPDFCNVASGWEKGIVEKNVQDSRRRIWQEASEKRFASFEDLNVWLAQRCPALWSQIAHPEYPHLTIADVLEQERESLLPMMTPFDGYVETLAKVSSTCLITVARNRYSVPCEHAGQLVSARLYPNRVVAVASDAVIASHPRARDRNHTCYDWQHYLLLLERKPGALRNGAPFMEMPAPLAQLRLALLNQERGRQCLARVLGMIPQAGLDAVLVATELALEATTPSGRISVEHIENILSRLRESQAPAQVATTLKAVIAPLANTQRYDKLRTTVSETIGGNHA